MRRRPPSPGLCGLRQARQDTPPGAPRPPSRWGPAQVSWPWGGGGASRAPERLFSPPPPAEPPAAARTYGRVRTCSGGEPPLKALSRAGPLGGQAGQ